MDTEHGLPYPHLSRGRFGALDAWSDGALFDACGVRIAFSERAGGVSGGAYGSLNLGSQVGDDPAAVVRNRQILCEAFGTSPSRLVVPVQVHGDKVLFVPDGGRDAVAAAQKEAEGGIDALLVEAIGVAALLCFADCIPVAIVSPSGRFALVHAGWRGVENGIAPLVLRRLAALDAQGGVPSPGRVPVPSQASGLAAPEQSAPGLTAPEQALAAGRMNIYIGAYIHAGCFEADEALHARFTAAFGALCAPDPRHIDLGYALRESLCFAGADPKRIADVGICTACTPGQFFSFRAQGGTTGRHGAFAIRKELR